MTPPFNLNKPVTYRVTVQDRYNRDARGKLIPKSLATIRAIAICAQGSADGLYPRDIRHLSTIPVTIRVGSKTDYLEVNVPPVSDRPNSADMQAFRDNIATQIEAALLDLKGNSGGGSVEVIIGKKA